MKCTNCSNEVPDSATFCGFCGHQLRSGTTIKSDEAITNIPPKKKKPLIGLWIGLGILIVLILLIVIGSTRRNTPIAEIPPEYLSQDMEESTTVIETAAPQSNDSIPLPKIDPLLLPSVVTQYIGTPQIEVVEHFNNLTDNEWYYSDNVNIVNDQNENILEIPGLQDLKGYFCSPEFQLDQGILTKIKLSGSEHLMEFFIQQNKWDTPEYKRFGGSIYQTDQMITNIWEGTDNSQSNQVLMGNLRLIPDKWYGLFVGGTKNGKFTFLTWDLEDPNTFVVQQLDKNETWATGLWISCFQVGIGNLYLDDYS
ncbi:zinc ribbon domain-containing protein, partial [bacterium]|nr:zinc ribbon domain-containing protein [bacterium]